MASRRRCAARYDAGRPGTAARTGMKDGGGPGKESPQTEAKEKATTDHGPRTTGGKRQSAVGGW